MVSEASRNMQDHTSVQQTKRLQQELLKMQHFLSLKDSGLFQAAVGKCPLVVQQSPQEQSCRHRIYSEGNILMNHSLNQEFVSATLSMDSDYDAGTCKLLADVNGALMLDHEKKKKEIDSITRRLLEQLNSEQDKHGESVSNIHVQAEKCLVKVYVVDQRTSSTTQRRVVSVPSPSSIEDI